MNRKPTLAARLRYIAAGVAGVVAVLYFLIGIEILAVGRPADGGAPDLLAFGLLVGGAHLVAAVLLALFARRAVWLGVAAFQVMVIVGYFALADVRDPHFELWGLVVKLLQVVVLAMSAYLALRGTTGETATRASAAGA
jgi:hypothetical protein